MFPLHFASLRISFNFSWTQLFMWRIFFYILCGIYRSFAAGKLFSLSKPEKLKFLFTLFLNGFKNQSNVQFQEFFKTLPKDSYTYFVMLRYNYVMGIQKKRRLILTWSLRKSPGMWHFSQILEDEKFSTLIYHQL